jgi:hypothetical protein
MTFHIFSFFIFPFCFPFCFPVVFPRCSAPLYYPGWMGRSPRASLSAFPLTRARVSGKTTRPGRSPRARRCWVEVLEPVAPIIFHCSSLFSHCFSLFFSVCSLFSDCFSLFFCRVFFNKIRRVRMWLIGSGSTRKKSDSRPPSYIPPIVLGCFVAHVGSMVLGFQLFCWWICWWILQE